MALMEMNLLSGFLGDDRIALTDNLKLVETSPGKIHLYFVNLNENTTCVNITQYRIAPVAKTMEALVSISDYYEPRTRVEMQYKSLTLSSITLQSFCGENCTIFQSNVRAAAISTTAATQTTVKASATTAATQTTVKASATTAATQTTVKASATTAATQTTVKAGGSTAASQTTVQVIGATTATQSTVKASNTTAAIKTTVKASGTTAATQTTVKPSGATTTTQTTVIASNTTAAIETTVKASGISSCGMNPFPWILLASAFCLSWMGL
uniref:Cell wall protein AWA1-like n=1 Tax=Petromyzon marinus TaxID=7757 RepID=A0AAJ7TEV3_PETMA|nr:cell wall protein AWA1-like [Petromyzon marinus]